MKYKRFYIDKEKLNSNILDGDEFLHATRVLRMREGDFVSLFCNDKYDYIAKITKINKNNLFFEVTQKIQNQCNPNINVTLFQALAKNEKLELITQKLTEIGISKIVPFYSKNCDIKPNTTKTNRLEKIAIGACKQCGRSIVPEILNISNLKNLNFSNYDIVLFANETENSANISSFISPKIKYNSIGIIIGPEGGFDLSEIELLSNYKNVKSISLGKRILRTETAGLYILSYLTESLNI